MSALKVATWQNGRYLSCAYFAAMIARIHPWLEPLKEVFLQHADPDIARGQSAYMKDKFEFFGLKTPLRRALTREYVKQNGLPAQGDLEAVVRSSWNQRMREFHYTGMELLSDRPKDLGPEVITLAEHLILTHSWWDTVDHIAVHVVGEVLGRNRELIHVHNDRWMRSNELWLFRTALVFQLHYQKHTDAELLFSNIRKLAAHQDFFIRKGIGWALRQYARIDPQAVSRFVSEVRLSPLSLREALKHIKA